MGYRYIGSKTRIVKSIIEYLGEPSSSNSRFVDAMCGTGIVAYEAALAGWPVLISDRMLNAVIMSEARLLSYQDVEFRSLGGYKAAIDRLNSIQPKEGFFWREYSPASKEFTLHERRYFKEDNAKHIDAIRACIAKWYRDGVITDKEHTLLLADLMSSINDVANIAGTYGCFLSKWTKQSQRTFQLNGTELLTKPVSYEAMCCDVFTLPCTPDDVVYIDPPYTKRQYASYYHILETIAQEDEPVVEGVCGLRPWKQDASVFCYKLKAQKALVKLLTQLPAKKILLSYSNDGHVDIDSLQQELAQYGEVEVINLQSIGSYRPNSTAVLRKSEVEEYLIIYTKGNEKYGCTNNV